MGLMGWLIWWALRWVGGLGVTWKSLAGKFSFLMILEETSGPNIVQKWGLKLPLQSEGTCALYKPGFPAFFVVAKWCCDLSNCNGASTL